jgi:hypothetical protein
MWMSDDGAGREDDARAEGEQANPLEAEPGGEWAAEGGRDEVSEDAHLRPHDHGGHDAFGGHRAQEHPGGAGLRGTRA